MMIDRSIEMGGFVLAVVVTLCEPESLILRRVIWFRSALKIRLWRHELVAELAHTMHIVSVDHRLQAAAAWEPPDTRAHLHPLRGRSAVWKPALL
jgi:hypothetical protein